MSPWRWMLVGVALGGCGRVTPVDNDGDGWFSRSDCNDNDPLIHPGATEVPADGVDNDCNPNTRDDDLDGDGFMPPFDCEPLVPHVPSSIETPYDGLDNDCDPSTPDDDLDADGFPLVDDCDDDDPDVNPGAPEEPYDGVDNDCDPSTSDDDLDGDGVPGDLDCDDEAAEVIDPLVWYADCDGDGYAASTAVSELGCDPPDRAACESGAMGSWTMEEPVDDPNDPTNTTTDCNDQDGNTYPLQPGYFGYAGGTGIRPYDFDCDGTNELQHGHLVCTPLPSSGSCAVTPGYTVLFPQCGATEFFVDFCTFDPASATCIPDEAVEQLVLCQ